MIQNNSFIWRQTLRATEAEVLPIRKKGLTKSQWFISEKLMIETAYPEGILPTRCEKIAMVMPASYPALSILNHFWSPYMCTLTIKSSVVPRECTICRRRLMLHCELSWLHYWMFWCKQRSLVVTKSHIFNSSEFAYIHKFLALKAQFWKNAIPTRQQVFYEATSTILKTIQILRAQQIWKKTFIETVGHLTQNIVPSGSTIIISRVNYKLKHKI